MTRVGLYQEINHFQQIKESKTKITISANTRKWECSVEELGE